MRAEVHEMNALRLHWQHPVFDNPWVATFAPEPEGPGWLLLITAMALAASLASFFQAH
jgi:hypothetical protein